MDTKILKHFQLGLYLILAINFGCEADLDLPDGEQQLIVEAWIEAGKSPKVLLSQSAPFLSKIDSVYAFENRVSTASVQITTDNSTYNFRLTEDNRFFPPIIYEGKDLVGIANKNYEIKIRFRGQEYTAQTNIPEAIKPDRVWTEIDPLSESNKVVKIKLSKESLNLDVPKYFRVLIKREGIDKKYYPPPGAIFSSQIIQNEELTITYRRQLRNSLDNLNDDGFGIEDDLSVKFCTITPEEFNYWVAYQNEILSSSNPFSASQRNLPSQFEDALGVFGGYSAIYYTFNNN